MLAATHTSRGPSPPVSLSRVALTCAGTRRATSTAAAPTSPRTPTTATATAPTAPARRWAAAPASPRRRRSCRCRCWAARGPDGRPTSSKAWSGRWRVRATTPLHCARLHMHIPVTACSCLHVALCACRSASHHAPHPPPTTYTRLADNEAQGTRGVISMSIGGGGPDSLWDAACEAAHDDGMVRRAHTPRHTLRHASAELDAAASRSDHTRPDRIGSEQPALPLPKPPTQPHPQALQPRICLEDLPLSRSLPPSRRATRRWSCRRPATTASTTARAAAQRSRRRSSSAPPIRRTTSTTTTERASTSSRPASRSTPPVRRATSSATPLS